MKMELSLTEASAEGTGMNASSPSPLCSTYKHHSTENSAFECRTRDAKAVMEYGDARQSDVSKAGHAMSRRGLEQRVKGGSKVEFCLW